MESTSHMDFCYLEWQRTVHSFYPVSLSSFTLFLYLLSFLFPFSRLSLSLFLHIRSFYSFLPFRCFFFLSILSPIPISFLFIFFLFITSLSASFLPIYFFFLYLVCLSYLLFSFSFLLPIFFRLLFFLILSLSHSLSLFSDLYLYF